MREVQRVARRAWVARVAGAAVWLFGGAAFGQVVRPAPEVASHAPEPELSLAVRALLDAAYLTTEERAALRVEHGAWTEADLTRPVLAARAALATGRLDAPALRSPEADALDRIEAMAERGELRDAVSELEGMGGARAARIRAEALERLGELESADAAVDALVAELARSAPADAREQVEAVRALAVRTRIRGVDGAAGAGADYRAMLALLADARQRLDRFDWRSRVLEAQLLAEKSNPAEARGALLEAMALHPRASEAWRLLGWLAVRSFAFDEADAVAAHLDTLAGGVSPGGGVIRARARLRQNDPDGAWAALEPVLRRYPAHREALAVRAAVYASWFDEARVEEALAEFDALNGTEGSAEALLEVGRRLSEARQYERAGEYLRRALARRPNLAEGWTELGLMEVQAARDASALDALRRAVALDPFHTRAANSLKLIEQMIAWPTIETEHFTIRYRAGIDEVLAREMPAVLERLHQSVAGAFEHTPSRRTLIDLMPDHAAFAVRITGMPSLHTVAAATGPAIAMESPQEGPGFSIGVYDWARALQHEYGHTVTLSRTRNRIPHWFTEAAAVWAEDRPKPPEWWELLARAHAEGGLFGLDEISVKFVRPEGPNERTQAYAQGHWMYEFLVERWGRGAALELMDLYAEGRSEASAFEAVLGVPGEVFFGAFEAWAGDELRRRGLLLAEGLPDLDTLVLREAVRAGARTSRDAAAVPAREPLEELDRRWSRVERAWASVEGPTRAQLQSWLGEHPGHPEVLAAMVEVELRARRGTPTPDMQPLLSQLIAARPEDPRPHRLLARLALEGRLEGGAAVAVESLEFLDARESYTPVYARALAERYAAAGDLVGASEKSERVVVIAPFDAESREFAARVAIQSRRWDDADRHLRALMAIEPDRDIHVRRLERLREMRQGG